MRAINNKEGYFQKRSGSYREGFRLTTSDLDMMGWFPIQRVISDLSLVSLYRINQDTVVLMECDELHVPSGYTRLKVIDWYDVKVRCCCITVNSEKYVSSSLAQEMNLFIYKQLNPLLTALSFQHGPCATFILQNTGIDFVCCFKSQRYHWPDIASPWIQRSQKRGLPSNTIISNILRSGFFVVPIGNSPDKQLE